MKILSLDTSTKVSGYAVYDDNDLIYYSSIDKSSIKDSELRMMAMVSGIFILMQQYKPDVVVIEEMVVPRNPQTQRMLTMILGAVYGQCIQAGIHYCSLRPTQWRAAVKYAKEKLPRKRDDLKVWSISKVNDLFNISGIDDNISDAILIGQAYINMKREGKK